VKENLHVAVKLSPLLTLDDFGDLPDLVNVLLFQVKEALLMGLKETFLHEFLVFEVLDGFVEDLGPPLFQIVEGFLMQFFHFEK